MANAVASWHQNWALLSIAGQGMKNAGNRLVELALLNSISAPTICFSVFSDPLYEWIDAIKAAGCRLALCSGTTLLTEKNSYFWKWANLLSSVGIRCGMVAGCFWNLKANGTDSIPQSDAVLSVRDPYSQEVCRRLGIDLPLVACPSLLLSDDTPSRIQGKRILIGFHRQQLELQLQWFTDLAQRLIRPLRVLVQEPQERAWASKIALRADCEVIYLEDLRTLAEWREIFDNVALCVSGRLHQVLPAVAFGIPSLLVLPEASSRLDSRLSLLTYLDIPFAVMTAETYPERLARNGKKERIYDLLENLHCFVDALFLHARDNVG